MSEDSKEQTEQQQQQQRTFLRERFLRMMGAMSGLDASVRLHDRSTVQCQLGVADLDFEKLQVWSLTTPMGMLPHAVLRIKDVVTIHVPHVGKKPPPPPSC